VVDAVTAHNNRSLNARCKMKIVCVVCEAYLAVNGVHLYILQRATVQYGDNDKHIGDYAAEYHHCIRALNDGSLLVGAWVMSGLFGMIIICTNLRNCIRARHTR
jgi:hypothetical protein